MLYTSSFLQLEIMDLRSFGSAALSTLHHLWALSGIYRFEKAGGHQYHVTDLEVDTRWFVESRPGRPC